MHGTIWMIWGIGLLALLIGIFYGRGMWEITDAWKYRDPEANAPSDDYIAFRKFMCFVAAAVCLVAGFVLKADLDEGASEDRERTSELERY